MTTGAAENPKPGLCSGFGQWHSNNNKRDPRRYVTVTLPDIRAMMPDPPSVDKSMAQWAILSTLLSRIHSEQREKGKFHGLCTDIDETEGTPTTPVDSVNPWSNLKPVYDARLDGGVASQWFIAGANNKTVKLFTLGGNKIPQVETRTGWNSDGIEFKVRITAAAKAMDYRGLYSNYGA